MTVKCSEECAVLCYACAFMYEGHDPEWTDEGAGLCTTHKEKRKWYDRCEHFFCRHAATNDPRDIYDKRKIEKNEDKSS